MGWLENRKYSKTRNNVSEWSDMSTRWLLHQWASTIKIQLSVLCWSSTKWMSSHQHTTCSGYNIAENHLLTFIHCPCIKKSILYIKISAGKLYITIKKKILSHKFWKIFSSLFQYMQITNLIARNIRWKVCSPCGSFCGLSIETSTPDSSLMTLKSSNPVSCITLS